MARYNGEHPAILIGVPVFQGSAVVAETLNSIRNQDFLHFRVLISVDGSDTSSYDACLPFTKDPRFELVLQPRQLGWKGNVNWLAGRLREEFFVYWQQDDLCDPSYLHILIEHARKHPEASCVYSDVQHFGTRKRFDAYPSLRGFAVQRVLEQIQKNGLPPHRGLIRRDAMRAALPILQPGPWVASLARAGELHRIALPLYHRRRWSGSLSARLKVAPELLRDGTLEWGLGCLRAALPIVPRSDRTQILAFIADQLVNHQPLGGFHYKARTAGDGEPLRFIADFLREARSRYGIVPFAELLADDNAAPRLIERKAEYSGEAAEILILEALLDDLEAFRSAANCGWLRTATRSIGGILRSGRDAAYSLEQVWRGAVNARWRSWF